MRVHTESVLACALACLLAAPAYAGYAHRYSFTSDASDSIGGADGTVVDGGAPVHSFSGGQLDLTLNPNEGSNSIVDGAYVDLPNGIVSAASAAGSSGTISFEWWATQSETRTWTRLGDFGTSNGGEDMSPSGSDVDYLMISPNSGRYADGLEMTNHADTGEEPNAGLTGPFPTGEEQHVVASYNQKQNKGGATNGTMHLYLNGAEVATGDIAANVDINTLDDVNNWLGRSQWPDALFAGSFNEFRIYDSALGAGEVERSYAAGPDVGMPGAAPLPTVPEPTTMALLALAGAAALGFRRRKVA